MKFQEPCTAMQMQDIKNVGFIAIDVISARGLRSADYLGLSDPYVTVELGNKFSRTQTVYNNLDPVWNKPIKL